MTPTERSFAGWAASRGAIFIHVPKTAGHSIAAALSGESKPRSLHIPYFVYQKADRDKFSTFFKFAFVRNPWDRLVSAYAYMARPNNRHAYRDILANGTDFAGFVNWLAGQDLRPRQELIPLIPQSRYLCDDHGSVMVDFVGRYEALHDGFAFVRDRLAVGCQTELPRLNASDHDDYRVSYTSETADLVAQIYATDIKTFGYRFD